VHEYPSLLRIRYDNISPAYGKRYFEEIGDYKDLFKQELVITEKVDGSQMAIGWKNGQPYLQGKNSHIPEFDKRKAYYGAWSWAWANISKLEKLSGFLVYGEWARVQHSLPYDDLPDWFLAFDVYDLEKARFLNWDKVVEFAKEVGLTTVPELHRGKVRKDELPFYVTNRKSRFSTSAILEETRFDDGERALIQKRDANGNAGRFKDGMVFCEGCVIKPLQNPKFDQKKKTVYWTNCGKVITQEFGDCFEDDSHWTSERMRENKLAAWYGVKK